MKTYNATKHIRQMFRQPNTIPMCNILLVIFLIWVSGTDVLSLANTSRDYLLLPEAMNIQNEPRQGLPVVWIKKDGRVVFKEQVVEDLSKLPSLIKDRLKEFVVEDNKILIKADRDAEFGDIQAVLKVAEKVGIETVGLIVDAGTN